MMGDGNASIPTPQPIIARPMFGAYGGALHACSVHFVSHAGVDGRGAGPVSRARSRRCEGAAPCGKQDLVMNAALPEDRG